MNGRCAMLTATVTAPAVTGMPSMIRVPTSLGRWILRNGVRGELCLCALRWWSAIHTAPSCEERECVIPCTSSAEYPVNTQCGFLQCSARTMYADRSHSVSVCQCVRFA